MSREQEDRAAREGLMGEKGGTRGRDWFGLVGIGSYLVMKLRGLRDRGGLRVKKTVRVLNWVIGMVVIN